MAPVVRTTCPYCGVGCGIVASHRDDGSVAITGDPAHPANAGRLCAKGYALGETLGLADRLLYPKVGGRRVSWDDALDHVAGGLQRIASEHGPDSIAFYVSGQLLTEDYYVANKLMKGFIGSANIDTNSRLCMASAVAAHRRAFGEDVVPTSYQDLLQADVVVLVGSNAAWCHPVLYQRLLEEKERRPQLELVVIDPRRTPTCEGADLHLPIRPGTDVWLFNGLLAYLHQAGLMDRAYVHDHTCGMEEALAVAYASAADAAAVARVCGTDAQRIANFFRIFGAAERVVTAFSQGVNQSSSGTDKVNSIINCHLLTGRIGKAGAGPFSLTGQPNAMGGREVGGLSNMLAAHLELDDPHHQDLVARFWSSAARPSRVGLKAVELFEAVGRGAVKAVWIMATNPLVSLPDADRVRAALRGCELVILSDCIENTDTCALAHVLLPAATWGEKNGTVTNSERRISRQRAFVPLPAEARPDWWIVCEVAKRLGFRRAFGFESPAQIFVEHARLSGFENCGTRAFDISGLGSLTEEEYEALEPVRWPVAPSTSKVLAQELFAAGSFMHPDRKARFIATTPRLPANALNEEFPLVLNTGRIRDQWHTMTRTARSARLVENQPEPFIELHPQEALARAVRDGELARVTSRWGTLVAKVRCSAGVARGSAFVPMHWSDAFASEARVGALINPAVDPVSGQPELKHTPVRVEPFPVKWYGFLFSRRVLTETGFSTVPSGCRSAPIAWWVRAKGPAVTRYELAGRELPADWAAWCRSLLGVTETPADYFDYDDPSVGVYRAGHVANDQLQACICISSRPELAEREPLRALFELPTLPEFERLTLLAGGAQVRRERDGPLLCSCFEVGRGTIVRAIEKYQLTDAREVGERLSAGTNCGSCLPEIRELLQSRLVS